MAGAVVSYATQVQDNLAAGKDLGRALTTNIDPTQIIGGALLGAAVGATVPAILALGSAAVTGSAAVATTAAAGTGSVGAAGLAAGASAVVRAVCADGDCSNEIRATGQAAQIACGGNCSDEVGQAAQQAYQTISVTSPNGGEWLVKAPKGSAVTINITSITNNVTNNFIDHIINKIDNSSRVILRAGGDINVGQSIIGRDHINIANTVGQLSQTQFDELVNR